MRSSFKLRLGLASSSIWEQKAGRLASQGGDRKSHQTSTSGRLILKEVGLTWQDSHRAQLVAAHRDLIPVVAEEARENVHSLAASSPDVRNGVRLHRGSLSMPLTELPFSSTGQS